MDKQGVQHTTLTYHELQNTLIVVWSSFRAGNTSTDMVCHQQECIIKVKYFKSHISN